jgi:hypothetical protein
MWVLFIFFQKQPKSGIFGRFIAIKTGALMLIYEDSAATSSMPSSNIPSSTKLE